MEIREIKVSECNPFRGNPFKIKEGPEMDMLIQSIEDSGVLVPIVVRPQVAIGYEILSGHRRVEACKRLGIETIPAIERQLDRDQAVIFMVDSNMHREGLLPSEKAFAYKMKVEALKHQGRTSVQLGQKSSRAVVAEAAGVSETQIQRYIRLTGLDPALLELVDQGRIALTPAVELSYLTPVQQRDVVEFYQSDEVTPSYSQSVKMRKLSEEGILDSDRIFSVLSEIKGNQVEYLKLPTDSIRSFFRPDTSPDKMREIIVKALDYYSKMLERQRRDRDAR